MNWILLIILFALYGSSKSSLNDQVSYFETFHHSNLKHKIVKREIFKKNPDIREFKLTTLGREFKVSLHKDNSMFSQNFRVIAVNKNIEKVIDFDPGLYHGYLEDEPGSIASVYFEEDGLFTGSIQTSSGKYVFEPSWRHLPENKNVTMISYREKDVHFEKDLGHNFCGIINPTDTKSNMNNNPERKSFEESHYEKNYFKIDVAIKKNENVSENEKRRDKRTSSCTNDDKMICTVLLVADYKFFKNIGGSNYEKTTSYLISQLDQVNQIYSKQEFGICGKGFEFEIREIRIHGNYSELDDSMNIYNTNQDLNTTTLLETFSRNKYFENFCLAHLFTFTPYDNGVLGLAYIGSHRINSPGGVCSSSYNLRGWQVYLNTGWSSAINKYKRNLLTTEYAIVTAHEFGHNWGSEHDPDTVECSPKDGKFIMNTYSVSGRDQNNKVFSPCSRRSMGAVIKSKAQSCFSKKTGAFCGNYKIDEGEECDEGPPNSPKTVVKLVSCCKNCKLINDYECSDTNHQCCEECYFAGSNKNCIGDQDHSCKIGSYCSGTDSRCLPGKNKENGLSCMEYGKCFNGNCLSFCEYENRIPCLCQNVNSSCKICCKENQNAVCLPYEIDTNLPPMSPCAYGYCDNMGVCQKQVVHNTVQRLWKIIENITVNQLVMFMRANIVGTVIVLSLVLWIPVSCIVAAVDRKRSQRERDEYAWYSPNNDQLILPSEEHSTLIRKSKRYA